MGFIAVRFDVDGPLAEAWSDALLEAGALSAEITDPHAGTPEEQAQFGEPGEAQPSPWDRSRITALFAGDADPGEAIERAARALAHPLPEVHSEHVDDQDWVRLTQAQFGPITIAGRIHVVPSWCAPPAEGIVVSLDPGLAFGTGSHPTTHLCIEWLADTVEEGSTVLDYGCGSGILAIVAAKLGAGCCTGVDIDAQALQAAGANARANQVALDVMQPDELGDATFDVVVANILTNPLVALAPVIAARVRPGGRLALAGLLDAQADEVASAYSRWFTLRAGMRREGWTLLHGRRAPS